MPEITDRFHFDRIEVRVCDTAESAGACAAQAAADEIGRLVGVAGRAIVILDAGDRLGGLLGVLSSLKGISWTRVVGLQLSEIPGAGEDEPWSRRRFLVDNLIARVPMAEFHAIRGNAANPEAVCANYDRLLNSRPPDFAILDLESLAGLSDAGFLAGSVGTSRVRIVPPGDAGPGAIGLTLEAVFDCGAVFIYGAGCPDEVHGFLAPENPQSVWRNHPRTVLFLDDEAADVLRR